MEMRGAGLPQQGRKSAHLETDTSASFGTDERRFGRPDPPHPWIKRDGYAANSTLLAPSSVAPATTANASVHAWSYSAVHTSPAISAMEAISTSPTTG